MTISNNITRLLDSRKVPYQVFELPAEKLGADETARFLNLDPKIVYKTIVVTRERGKPILAVIPGPHRVDLKLLAAVVGEKKVSVPPMREAEALTGLQAGGISPLALIHRGFQVIIAAEAEALPGQAELHVSGGVRGVNIRLPARALAELTGARFARISQPDLENKS